MYLSRYLVSQLNLIKEDIDNYMKSGSYLRDIALETRKLNFHQEEN